MNTLPLNTSWSLDSFVVLPSNQEAYDESLAFCAGNMEPGLLAIEGEYAEGKTHLLFSMGQSGAPSAGFRAVSCSGETFNHWWVDRMNGSKEPVFEEGEFSLGLLLIDDLHYMTGKEFTQQAVGELLADWIAKGLRIACTCPDLGRDLPGFLQVMEGHGIAVTRCHVHRPEDHEMRLILEQASSCQGWDIPDVVYEEAIRVGDGSVRRAVGLVIRYAAHEALMLKKTA